LLDSTLRQSRQTGLPEAGGTLLDLDYDGISEQLSAVAVAALFTGEAAMERLQIVNCGAGAIAKIMGVVQAWLEKLRSTGTGISTAAAGEAGSESASTAALRSESSPGTMPASKEMRPGPFNKRARLPPR